MPTTATSTATPTFEADVEFLTRHAPVKVLTAANGGRIAISAQYQARVMTSAVAAGAPSLGFLNRSFISEGKSGTQFDNYGGEDRFWLGPEGGQYGLYFPASQPFTFEHWQTPSALQEGAWAATDEAPDSVTYRREFSVRNHSQRDFEVAVQRKLLVFSAEQAAELLGMPIPTGVQWVGYASENQLKNVGSDSWTEGTGLLSIWILGMFAPVAGTRVIIPFERAATGPLMNDAYFGKIPAERLLVCEREGYLLFLADGKQRGKLGLGPTRAKGMLGSYSEPAGLLTIVSYNKQPAARRFVNSMWEQQDAPYSGDELNSYNDGPPAPGKPALGGFYEIESSSPAAALAPGEHIEHVQRTFHFTGPRAALDALARHVLGVSLLELPPG